ncbi:hypothetical protein AL073_16220 [Loktanella sp. 1ANDIMAR09]|nr:hypothetical protein AL073_16220 [Loktanella sp. 1ANDIMAR09]
MNVLPRNSRNTEVSLSQVLQQTGTCLTQLSEKILDLEHTIWGVPTPLGEHVTHANALQALDFMKQATDDLAGLLERLGNAVPPAFAISESDVISPMKLEILRQVISTNANDLNAVENHMEKQEVELF